MNRLISRSGSTVAKVLRISLLLGFLLAVVRANSFAQSAPSPAENSPQIASLSAASSAEKSPSPATDSSAPSTPPATKSAMTSEEANAVAQMLQASLESKLKQWQAMTGLAQPAAQLNATAPDLAYVDQKIAALDRMIELLEQKQSVQAAAGVYQKRLEAMQRKIEERENKASDLKEE
jgi:hypothetical protein